MNMAACAEDDDVAGEDVDNTRNCIAPPLHGAAGLSGDADELARCGLLAGRSWWSLQVVLVVDTDCC